MNATDTTTIRGGTSSAVRYGWGVLIGLLLLLPILEWAGISFARWIDITPTAATAWTGMLVADGFVLLVLWRYFGDELRASLATPKVSGLLLMLLAFFIGWMIVPGVQVAAAPLAGIMPPVGGAGVSLIPQGAFDYVVLAMAAVMGALAQEGLYRGVLWSRVLAISGSEWVTVGITSILYGTLFWYTGLPTLLAVGVAWGLVASLLRKVTGSLGLVIALNGLNLFLTYAVLLPLWL